METEIRMIKTMSNYGLTNYISSEDKLISYGTGIHLKIDNVLLFLQSKLCNHIYINYSNEIYNGFYKKYIKIEINDLKQYNNDINIVDLIKDVEKYYPNIYLIKNMKSDLYYNNKVFIENITNFKINNKAQFIDLLKNFVC